MNIYDKSFISRKAKEAGFNRDTYEKVLRLVDVLEFINNDDILMNKLALKGGTAINLLEFDLPRLSVDIDLDYTVNASVEQMRLDRDEISSRIVKFMRSEGYVQKKNNRSSFVLDSYYFTYTNTGGNKDHIKFDINFVMRAHIYTPVTRQLITKEFFIDGGVNALNSVEIMGSKINALNNRAAVRDLYDVWKYIKSNKHMDENQLRKATIFYHVLTSGSIDGDFKLTPANNLTQHSILRELVPVLKKGEKFILEDVMQLVKSYIGSLMMLNQDELLFIEMFANGEYKPELLYNDQSIIERIKEHPMAKWKVKRLNKK